MSGGLGYKPRPNTARADHGAADPTGELHPNALKIGKRSLRPLVISMGYRMTEEQTFFANDTGA